MKKEEVLAEIHKQVALCVMLEVKPPKINIEKVHINQLNHTLKWLKNFVQNEHKEYKESWELRSPETWKYYEEMGGMEGSQESVLLIRTKAACYKKWTERPDILKGKKKKKKKDE